MNSRSIIAVIAGGLVAFIWSSVSWMLIPWHQPTMEVFENEEVIGQAIKEAAARPGIYTYPGWTDNQEEMQKKHDEGPYVFASVVPAGVGAEMGGMMLGGFLIAVIGAAFLLILMQTAPDGTHLKVGAIASLFVSLIPSLMNWNWWHYPVGFTVVGVVDSFISWMLAVLVMGAIAMRKAKN